MKFHHQILEKYFRNIKRGIYKRLFYRKVRKTKLHLKLTLNIEGDPVIKEIKRISKPGRRVYSRAQVYLKVMNGLGLAILSTQKVL